jgi:hypothetical protein
VACDLGADAAGAVSGGVEAITGGAVGIGNPVGDACNAVSGTVGGVVANPVTDALKSVGHGIFEQITDWVSEGAGWLIGEVVKGIDKSTSPKLTTESFIAQYGRMAQIAAILGLAMLLLAVLEGIARGDSTMLLRVVLVNVPLAFIATSVAYAVVQMLLVATDGLCQAIAATSHESSQDFFKGAITSLGNVGGDAGREINGGSIAGEASGSVAVPLFVTFLVAIIGAFAAFLVWLELLMRDGAIYVVASFMPFSLAAPIWPRWAGVLRKTGELLVAVIGSKFVIVSILALAAGLMAKPEGRIEPILAASALMVLACFAPFVLLKFVPFAESAMTAAYSRRSAGGGVISGVQIASDVQILRNMARSNWGDSGGVTLWEAGDKGASGGSGSSPGGPRSSGGGSGSGGGGGGAGSGVAGGSASGAAGAAGAAAAVPTAAVGAAKGASGRLQGTAAAKESGASTATPAASQGESAPGGTEGTPATEKQDESVEKPPRPAADRSGVKPEKGGKG